MESMKLRALLLMAISLFSAFAKATPESDFWKWFGKNESRLYENERNREAIFDELSAQMAKVNPDLTFEFGPVMPNGKRDFVVSAGGIKTAFPAVEALVSKAPSLRRWQIIKFRPRRSTLNDLEYGGLHVRVDDVRYLLAKDGEKVGIVLFMKGYDKERHSTFGNIGYLFLDEALGEYAVETQVGFIEFQGYDSKYFPKSSPLAELPAHFDEFMAGRVR